MDSITVSIIADRLLEAFDHSRQLPPITEDQPAFDLRAAYAVARQIADIRRARGERISGRKLGFTNRNLWPQYDVYTPIWGYTWDHSVHDARGQSCAFSLAARMEPLIEPEIVFGLRRGLAPGAAKPERILDALEWYAHGFEIVDSVFPGWKFQAPDTVAGFGLHAGLVIGEHRTIDHGQPAMLIDALASFRLTLLCDGEPMSQGGGANVLDSPLCAIGHYLQGLAELKGAEAPRAGEVITTGSLTDALPVRAGQTWTVEVRGLAVEPVVIRFTE